MIFSTLPDIWILAGEVVILSKGSKYLLLRWNDEDQLDQKKKRRIIIKDSILVTGSNFLVGILSKPDFWAIILLEILMVLIFALVPKRKKLQNSFWIWVFIPFIGIMGAFTFNHFTVKNSSYMALDVPNAFFLETVSPYLIADYPYYGNNLSDVISEEEIQIVGANREVIKNSFVPMVIARAGEKGYKIVRRDLVRTSLKLHFTEIVFRTGKEVFQYLFFPFSFIGNVLGKPNGRQVYNMTRMWKYSWVAAKEFLAAGSIAFGLIILSALGIYFV